MPAEPTPTTEGVLRCLVRDLRKERDDLLVIANKQAQELAYLKDKLEKLEKGDA